MLLAVTPRIERALLAYCRLESTHDDMETSQDGAATNHDIDVITRDGRRCVRFRDLKRVSAALTSEAVRARILRQSTRKNLDEKESKADDDEFWAAVDGDDEADYSINALMEGAQIMAVRILAQNRPHMEYVIQ